MIERIKGLIVKKGSSSVILAVNGIGLEINMSINALESLPSIGKEIQILTFLNVREDLLELYGFVNRLERQSFLLLISISGIGPKLALTIPIHGLPFLRCCHISSKAAAGISG